MPRPPRPTAPPRPRLPLPSLLALSAAAALTLITELLPAGVLPQLAAALHTSEGRVGYLATGYAAAATAAAIPFAAASRGLPRRPLLIALLAGLAAANLATALSSGYLVTFAVRLGAGLLNGMVWSMIASYAARLVPAGQRGRAIAIALAGIPVAVAAGLPAATALAGALGWRFVFGLLAGLIAVLAAGLRVLLPPVPGQPAGTRVSVAGVGRLPGVRTVLAVNGLLLIGHQAMYTYVAPYTRHAGYGSTSVVLLVFGLAAVAGIWLTAAVVDRHLRLSVLTALAAIAAALLALGVLGLGPPGQHAPALLGAVALWGLAFGGCPTLLQTALINAAGTRHADTASALQTTVYNAGIAAGALLGGLTLDTIGPEALPWIAAALPTGALLLAGTTRTAVTGSHPAARRRAAAQPAVTGRSRSGPSSWRRGAGSAAGPSRGSCPGTGWR